ncbi:MAG: adenylate kinase [archaeon]
MNLILLGPPGSGKGTQAKKLAETLRIPHVSTGDIFRQNIAEQTELGLQVKSILDAGQLVPNEVTDQMVKNRLEQPDCVNGFILDGYPRNVHQAEYLDSITQLDRAINIEVSDAEVTKRLSSRRSCPKCKKVYNLLAVPPKAEGKCDACGADLIIRDDDKPEVIADRLIVYHEQTEPILDYYRDKELLADIDGTIGIDAVTTEILKILGINLKPTA